MTVLDFTESLEPTPPRGRQRHRLTWFLVNGTVGFELKCVHEPVAAPFHCDGQFFKDDESTFPECFTGGKTPLRDGVIESWWTGSEEDSEVWWQYADDESGPAGLG